MMNALPGWLLHAILWLVSRSETLSRIVNRIIINSIVGIARTRPHPWSTERDYVSWRSLTDRTWSARHLPPHEGPVAEEPPVESMVDMFRPRGERKRCPKSTLLFPAFAQYLTDGFIRTDMEDRRRNTSNHEIDLCPLYGRTPDQTHALRLCDEAAGRRGRLKSQMIGGEEYAQFLFDGDVIAAEFACLDEPLGLSNLTGERQPLRSRLFAFGGDRANAAPQVAAMNTLFLREHNRLAGLIEAENPDWDDDRVFETARNSVIVIFIKIVIEDYINHIAPIPFTLRADPSVVWKAAWNRPNWITAEFSLLYRWHGLIPDEVEWGGAKRPVATTFMDNDPLLKGGLLRAFQDLSGQAAGTLGPFRTTEALLNVEEDAIRQGRTNRLRSLAEYRRYLSLPIPRRFEDISSDPEVVAFLKARYKRADEVEFYVGLFAEDVVVNSPLPLTILKFVALDAFSQALPNPLLSEHVFRRETFSGPGWRAIHDTTSLRDVVLRNAPGGAGDAGFIGMTRPGWSPQIF